MFKRFLFAFAPLFLLAGSVMAEDDLFSTVAKMDLSKADVLASDVAANDGLGEADVEALLNDGEQVSNDEAIAACFRRFGYGYRSYGCYYRYRSCYSPCYTTYYSYPAISCYRPVTYSYYTPVYSSYWGCW